MKQTLAKCSQCHEVIPGEWYIANSDKPILKLCKKCQPRLVQCEKCEEYEEYVPTVWYITNNESQTCLSMCEKCKVANDVCSRCCRQTSDMRLHITDADGNTAHICPKCIRFYQGMRAAIVQMRNVLPRKQHSDLPCIMVQGRKPDDTPVHIDIEMDIEAYTRKYTHF